MSTEVVRGTNLVAAVATSKVAVLLGTRIEEEEQKEREKRERNAAREVLRQQRVQLGKRSMLLLLPVLVVALGLLVTVLPSPDSVRGFSWIFPMKGWVASLLETARSLTKPGYIFAIACGTVGLGWMFTELRESRWLNATLLVCGVASLPFLLPVSLAIALVLLYIAAIVGAIIGIVWFFLQFY